MNTKTKILVLLSIMFFSVMAIYAASGGVTVTLTGRGNVINYAPPSLPCHYYCDGSHSLTCTIEVTVEK
jgi:hypothetical protein